MTSVRERRGKNGIVLCRLSIVRKLWCTGISKLGIERERGTFSNKNLSIILSRKIFDSVRYYKRSVMRINYNLRREVNESCTTGVTLVVRHHICSLRPSVWRRWFDSVTVIL